MLTNLSANLSTRFPNSAKFQEVKVYSANRDVVKALKNDSFSSDILEISPEAKAISYEEFKTHEEKINNNNITSTRNDETEDPMATEARRKLTAMKIAQRIARGDNVPMQDHRFLAEYDSALYKVSLKASLTADNDDPETHESLAEELLAIENIINNRDGQASLVEPENVEDQTQDETG